MSSLYFSQWEDKGDGITETRSVFEKISGVECFLKKQTRHIGSTQYMVLELSHKLSIDNEEFCFSGCLTDSRVRTTYKRASKDEYGCYHWDSEEVREHRILDISTSQIGPFDNKIRLKVRYQGLKSLWSGGVNEEVITVQEKEWLDLPEWVQGSISEADALKNKGFRDTAIKEKVFLWEMKEEHDDVTGSSNIFVIFVLLAVDDADMARKTAEINCRSYSYVDEASLVDEFSSSVSAWEYLAGKLEMTQFSSDFSGEGAEMIMSSLEKGEIPFLVSIRIGGWEPDSENVEIKLFDIK